MTKMSLASAAELVPQPRKGPTCTVGALIEELDDDDRDQFLTWLAMPMTEMTHRRLGRILRVAGHTVGSDAIGRHRNGECACRRS